MDPELSRHAKDLLERYRKAESLGSDARTRMLSGLRAKMSLGAPAVGAPKASALSKLAAAGKTKILLGVLAVSIPAAWTIQKAHRSVDYTLRTATPPVPTAPTVVTAPAVEAAPRATDGEPYGSASALAAVPFEALPEVAPESEPRLRSKRSSTAERSVTAADDKPTSPKVAVEEPKSAAPVERETAPEKATTESTLDQEMELLKRARLAQKAGHPAEALGILAQHAKEFPNGKLSESRDVARVIALCDAGQTQASRAAAERFLAQRPNSPFANRVRTACTNSEKGR
jgi:hypothetical protein